MSLYVSVLIPVSLCIFTSLDVYVSFVYVSIFMCLQVCWLHSLEDEDEEQQQV